MENTKKQLGFSKVFWGIVFFLNPLFSYLDLLPDFIGCLFLFAGLKPLLFLDVRAQTARRSARLIALLSVFRLLLTPVFFWSSTNDSGNTNLLVSFAFGVVSLMLELSLFRSLAELYNYLSVRCDSTQSIRCLDPAFSLLVIFSVMKNVCSMFPDFLTLFSPESLLEYNPGSERAAASFLFAKWTSYVALFVAILIFAVVVLCRLRRYERALGQEEGFLRRIASAARQAEEGACRLRLRFDFAGVLAMLTALALFSFDYYLDYVSILPSPAALCLCGAILYRLRPYRAVRRGELVFCVLGTAVTLGAYLYRLFYSQDTFIGVTFYTKPFTVFFGVAQAIFVFAAFLLASSAIARAAKEHAEIDLYPAKALATVFGLFSCAMNAYHYILPKGAGVTDLSEALSFFALVFGAVFLAFTWRIDSAFRKQAEWKFL